MARKVNKLFAAAAVAAAACAPGAAAAESKRQPPVGQRLVDVGATAHVDVLGARGGGMPGAGGAAAVAPRPDGWRPPRREAPEVGQDCSDFAGVFTGFSGGSAIGDAYRLSWRGPAFGPGAFSAVYISPASWSFGAGVISPDNTTVTLVLDAGRVTLNGTLSGNCSVIEWDNDTSWKKTTALPKRVHMVAMNHLDVGYNGIPEVGLINNVLNNYFTLYFPRAVAIADALRARGGSERFIYTTHAWLVELYLHCPSNFTLSGVPLACPSPADAAAFAAAIQAGDIVFHAAPFNIQYGGAYSQTMLDAIFDQPRRLAAELGVVPSSVASLRDVPGAPRSIIPGLARANISVLSIGVNNYAPSPQIPTPCVWREPATGDSVVLLMTKQGQGYPLNVGPSPVDPGGLGADVCVSHPASPAVLCWAFRTDNSGPPTSVAEVLDQFDVARWQWPGAEVVASTFDAWWAEFAPAVPQLPEYTTEMGETWLTGFASDPRKNTFYREAARQYAACLGAGGCDPADPRVHGFLLLLMKLPEHTWGLPTLTDTANYTNAAFWAARAAGAGNYADAEASWAEQRTVGEVYAVAALGDHPLRAAIEAGLAGLLDPVAPAPAAAGYTPVSAPGATTFTVALPGGGGSVSLALDGATGALARLTSPAGAVLADAAHTLGRLTYLTYNDTDYDAQHITVDNGLGCCCCYGWDNMQKAANPASTRTAATLVGAWASQPGTALTAPASVVVQVTFGAALHAQYGAPGAVWLNYTVAADGAVGVEVTVVNKTATRLGEALLLDFATPPAAGSAWLADVLGHYVDPLDVVVRGSQRQHGVGDGVAYVDATTGAGLGVVTLDAPVFSPWTAANETSTLIVPFYPLVGPVEGFSAVLFANAYNTNFPLYSTQDAWRQRFALASLAPSAARAAAARAARKAPAAEGADGGAGAY